MTTRPVINCATGQVTVEPIPDNELAMREAAAVAPDQPTFTDTQLAQLNVLGQALLADPNRFAELVADVAPSNTAKGPLQYVDTAIQAAAQVSDG